MARWKGDAGNRAKPVRLEVATSRSLSGDGPGASLQVAGCSANVPHGESRTPLMLPVAQFAAPGIPS